jgi:hypothetical protein
MDRDMDHYREDEPMTKLEELKASADAASDDAYDAWSAYAAELNKTKETNTMTKLEELKVDHAAYDAARAAYADVYVSYDAWAAYYADEGE